MSEGDVSLIRDEDVLRRMWQQTEDFSRKKEIRAHMYRLREERLRNLYSPEPTLDAKGCEFTSPQGHVNSFADQTFQSMKSKEVRDAGSPPKEFTYRGQDLKELSNAGWNVESENRTTDDGHTHVKNVQANIEGRYDVEGGKGQFAAIDHHKQAVTEYHDDNTSLKRNESSTNTAAHEQVVRQTDDGSHFSSTTSSSTSTSKFQQVSSTKHESVPYVTNDDYDLSRNTYDDNRNVDETSTRQVTRSSDYEQTLKRSDYEQGELVSRKVDYPDDNTKVIVETRCLPDGTRVTSTRREFRAPVVHSNRSEQRSQQSRSESKSYHTTSQQRSDVKESSSKITRGTTDHRTDDIVDSQRIVDDHDFKRNQQIHYTTNKKDDYSSKITRQTVDNRTDNIVDSQRVVDDHNFIKNQQIHYTTNKNNDYTTKTTRETVDNQTDNIVDSQRTVDDDDIKRNQQIHYTTNKKDDYSSTIIRETIDNRTDSNVDSQRVVDDHDFSRNQHYITTNKKDDYSQTPSDRRDKERHYKIKVDDSDRREVITSQDKDNVRRQDTNEIRHVKDTEEKIHKITRDTKVDETVERKTSSNQYQTTYTTDYTQRKISNDLSPSHQAWASTLRGDTPSTTRPSTRASSPGSRTFKSSTSSLRSSVSPDKTYRKPSSRGGSPNKTDKYSPSRTDKYSNTTHTTTTVTDVKTNRYTSPERRHPHESSPTTRSSPDKKAPSYRQRPSVSPEKKPQDLTYRPSTSPDRKPGRKTTPTDDYPRTSSPVKPTDRNVSPLRPTDRDVIFAKPVDRDVSPRRPIDRERTPTKPEVRDESPTRPTDRNGSLARPVDRDGTSVRPLDRDGIPTKPLNKEGTPTRPTDVDGTTKRPTDREGIPTRPVDKEETPRKPMETDDYPTKPSFSPDRKPGYQTSEVKSYPEPGYPSPNHSRVSPEKKFTEEFPKDSFTTRPSQSPDRKPGYQKPIDGQPTPTSDYPRTTSPTRSSHTKDDIPVRPNLSPDRKSGYERPSSPSTVKPQKTPDKYPKESSPTRPSVSPDRKPGYMRPTASSKPNTISESPRASPTRPYSSPERKSPVKHVPSQSPERKSYSKTTAISKVREDHNKFVEEETKMYTQTDRENTDYIKRKPSPSPDRYSIPHEKSPSPIRKSPIKDAPDNRVSSPTRKSPTKETPDRYSPSPTRKSPAKDTPERIASSPSRKSPTKDISDYRIPSPTRKSPTKTTTDHRIPSPARKSPTKDAPTYRVPSPTRKSPTKDAPDDRVSSPTRKSPSKDGPEYHRSSPTRKSPIKDAPDHRITSPTRKSPTKETSNYRVPSPARKSPIKDAPDYVRSPARKSPSKETPDYCAPSPARKSPSRDAPEYRVTSPTRKAPVKDAPDHRIPSPTRKSPTKDTPEYSVSSPARKAPNKEVPDYYATSPSRKSPTTDIPDFCRPESPSNVTRPTQRKSSRSPSPKGPVTFIEDRLDDKRYQRIETTEKNKSTVTDITDKYDEYTEDNVKEYYYTSRDKDSPTPTKTDAPVRELSPSKYGTYDKKKRSKEVEEITTVVTKDTENINYDSLTRRQKISSPKRGQEQPNEPTKKSPRDSVSPLKSPSKDSKYKLTTDFITTEKTTEEINKKLTTKEHPRQLITPSTSPSRKPKPVEKEPSTGQSSPTTSVSGFVYFSSPRTEKTVITDLDDEEYYTETDKTEEIATTYRRPESLDVKRSPSPSKIPCKSPSPDKRVSPSKENLPRKSSLKKPLTDTDQGSPIEKPPSSFRVSPEVEPRDIPEHKIFKKDRPVEPDTDSPIKPKPPLERRETYEERCRKILGMTDDDSTIKTMTTETSLHLRKPGSNLSSPSVSPCTSPIQKEGSPVRDYPVKKETVETKSHITDFITREQDDTTKKTTSTTTIRDRISTDRKSTTPSRDSSPTKLQDIISQPKTKEDITSTHHIQEDTTFISKTVDNKYPSPRPSMSPTRKPSEQISGIPTRSTSKKPEEPKLARTPSPTKKVTRVTEENTEFIASEREQEVLDRVQKSLRKLSPDRSERSPSPEKSPGKTITSLRDIDINTEIIKTDKTVNDDVRKTIEKQTVTKDIIRSGKPKDDKPQDTKTPSKTPSRNVSPIKKPIGIASSKVDKSPESPTKSRSISPRKPVTPTERPQSPQVPKTSGIKPREQVPSHLTRKPTPNATSPTKTEKTITTDIKKTSGVTKQNSFTKTTTTKTTTNKFNQSPTRKPTEPEQKKTIKGIKDNINLKKDTDTKVTRTPSDVSIKSKKVSPQRTKSKPEIQVSDMSTTKTTRKTTTTKNQKSSIKEPQTKLSNKPKSATALNTSTDEDDVIIDVQHAKSSRENSPDNICPTPISFLEDVGTPRLPDEVSEPDDDFRRRTHHTIHEAESIVDDIVEISEDDELFTKRTNVNRVTGSDECLLSVNDKVSKFTNKTGKVPKPKETTTQFKDTERRVHSDYIKESLKSDECLLSVSEKVNKFAKGPTDTKEKSPSRRIVDEYDVDTVYQDDYTKLSVNDKAHLFVETAESVKAPKTKPTQKMERLDLSNVDDSLKSDDCLLSVSDKVNKFVKTAEQFLTETQEVEEKERKIKEQHDKIMRRIVETTDDETYDTKKKNITEDRNRPDNKTPDHREDRLGSFAKETESSHAKVKDYVSPNLKPTEKAPTEKAPTEKAPTVKITTLRSSEAVKKAKALFENIASTTQKTKTTTQTKTTKLTDIGVIKKSPKTDSTIVLHPSVEDGSPYVTDVDSEVDAVPLGPNKDRPTSSTPTRGHYPGRVHDHKPRNSPTRLTTQSPEVPRTKSPTHRAVETTTITKTVLSRYPAAQRAESPKQARSENEKPEKPQDKVPGYQRPTKTSQIREETKALEEAEMSTRRGSGKFGVELRRTSVERSTVSSERRRSSVDHHQPCIEDIYDLDLLEQMLEKVVGYEQRRRIRAQIRVAKKTESEHVVDSTYTKTTKYTVSTPKNRSPERQSKTRSPERQPKTTSHKTLSPERNAKPSPQKNVSPDRGHHKEHTKPVLNGHPKEPVKNITDRRPRPHSSERTPQKTVPSMKSPARQSSPDKKTRPSSPSKASTPKSKTNRFNEYASAYMKKVGLNETDKIKFSEVKTKKSTGVEDHVTTNQVEEHKTIETKVSMTSMSKSFTERTSSKDTIEVIQVNGKRSPSPDKKRSPERKTQSPVDRLHQRTPSPEMKRHKSDTSKKETIVKTVYDIEKKIQPKQLQEEKPSWVTNRNLKKITSETRTFSNKKIDSDKPKYRAPSPSKVISKPTDVITSSYGPGPLDADGKPLFGIKALRNGATNYQVKGTVIRQEFHSRNGGEPEGTVSVTAYSTEPEDLEKLLHSQGERPSRIHGLAAITTTKKFGGDTGTTLKEAHSSEERATLEQFTHSDRRVADHRIEGSRSVERRPGERRTGAGTGAGAGSGTGAGAGRGERARGQRADRRDDKTTVRQSSVKSLTEKYIKSASDTSKSERNVYPKAGLILRTANMKDSVSSDSSAHAGVARTDSEHSLGSVDESAAVPTSAEQAGGTARTLERSFLDSSTKVTGVQDILTRMKNADIVTEEGDTNEDAEARALLNKFLGASVLMAGMHNYVTEKPTGNIVVKHETVRSSGGKVTSTNRSVQEFDIEQCWDERVLQKLLDECSDYEQRRRLRARIRTLMAEQEACTSAVTEALAAAGESTDTADSNEAREEEEVTTVTSSVRRNSSEQKTVSTTTKTSKVIESMTRPAPKPVSPFAKFRQLEKQNSTNSPNSPKTPQSPGSPSQPFFKFTDPALQASAVTIKERLLQWCRDKTRDYENVKLENFSTSWADGLAFCALVHHFLPNAFDYSKLTPNKRRHNFTLAFKVADEKAGIYPLLDVDDMVAMRKPDWKCVFTYVQSIHRRFKDQD